ncbi:MAG: hypothetical protein KGL44_03750 [Sphingomonadales bacterium]|nr:hypothetical protein [Sphingomonadales bacterium]
MAGYSARYSAAVVKLLKTEGGFVDDPRDHGGATNFGISLRFLASEGAFDGDGDGKLDFDLDMDGDIDGADIRRLSRDDAAAIYHQCFWQKVGAESLPPPLGEMVFDQAVNGGRSSAVKLLQRAVNDCLARAPKSATKPPLMPVDGIRGGTTDLAIRWVAQFPSMGVQAMVTAYREAAAERYRAIVFRNPSQKRFLAGWLNRANDLGR